MIAKSIFIIKLGFKSCMFVYTSKKTCKYYQGDKVRDYTEDKI